jgi:hypothetical protein
MAIAQITESPGGSEVKYEQVIREVGLTGSQLAPGQLVHFAGPMEGGGWRIVNMWESQEASDPFGEKLITVGMAGARTPAHPASHDEAVMSAISTIPAQAERLTMVLAALQPRGVAANGAARSAADAVLERLRWADELAAIEAEEGVTQAEEALSLG